MTQSMPWAHADDYAMRLQYLVARINTNDNSLITVIFTA
jgi:hypothetical protein